MDPKQLSELIKDILDSKKGEDIEVLDLTEQNAITDYFVIATARNVNHVRSLAEAVEEELELRDIFSTRKEGIRDGRWVVLDYDSVMVHIFNSQTRDFYCLEKLWKHEDK